MKHKEKGLEPSELFEKLFSLWDFEPKTETIPLADAAGRVLASDQFALYDIPVNRAAGMDGIALRSSDFAQGMPDTSHWTRGIEWEYADMGDDFDDSFDMVVPVEMAEINDGILSLMLEKPPKAGDCIRPKGSTVTAGRLLAPAKSMLRPVDLCALATGGIAEVPVIARPRVAFIPTGSELVKLGNVPSRGQCIDSNTLMVKPLLEQMGAEPLMGDIVADIASNLEDAVNAALDEADIVLVNGGSSKGSEDLNHPLLKKNGTLLSHWMAAGPGRPLCAGIMEGKPVVVVPGPPMSAFNVFEYFVRELIDHWYGMKRLLPTVSAVLDEEIEAPGHMLFLERVQVTRDGEGFRASPVPFKKDMIGALTCSGYFHSPIGQSIHEKGSAVSVKLLSDLHSLRGDTLV